MPLRPYATVLALALAAVGQQACVNATFDQGKIDGLVFNVRSLALRTITQSFNVDNPNGIVPQLGLTEFVAVLSDQDDVCSDMQAHILRKGSKQLQIFVGQVDGAGRWLYPAEDQIYAALDLATLAFASDSLPLPLKTLTDGLSQGLFLVNDDLCNTPETPERASSGGSVTVTRFDGAGMLADYDLRMGPDKHPVTGQFLAPTCPVNVATRPPATCRPQ